MQRKRKREEENKKVKRGQTTDKNTKTKQRNVIMFS